jgi:hypothetical protein
MERLKQLTEKLNRKTLEGASKEALLEIGFEIIRELMQSEKPVQPEEQVQAPKAFEPEIHAATVQSLNDRFNPSVPDLSDRLQQLRQGSLRSAMGINDRYIFLETLFRGDAHSFDTMMELLDHAKTVIEAELIAAQYIRSVQDNLEQAAVVEKFYDLLRSRFSAI